MDASQHSPSDKTYPTISLCVIVGNIEDRLLARFLTIFAPVADEVVLVFGDQDSIRRKCALDEVAFRVCRSYAVLYRSVLYRNDPARSDWGHVDDFAAKRNVGWDAATGDLLMWADTDDVMLPSDVLELRRIARERYDDFDLLQMRYVVPSEQVTLNVRERMVRRGLMRWVSPVHESLAPVEPERVLRALLIEDIVVTHAPLVERKEGSERNLRILRSIPEGELTTSHRFYLFCEEMAAGNEERAVVIGQAFLADPEAGPAEKYEILMHFARRATDAPTREKFLAAAVLVSPERREAIGELALLEMHHGKPSRAGAYLNMMESLPVPVGATWNTRMHFHGWVGVQLRCNFLRMRGEVAKADAIELNHFLRNGAKISLLHATRGRPVQAAEARRRWLQRAAEPDAIEHIFALDADDESAGPLAAFRHVCIPGGGPVAAWNAAFRESRGAVIVQMSDDWNPPVQWDRLILSRIAGCGLRIEEDAAVVAVSDGHRTDGLLCMAIATRATFAGRDWVFHPRFFSMYSDNWFTHEMRSRSGTDGRSIVIEAPDLVFEHLHPAFGKSEMDETYARSNRLLNYAQGKMIFEQLANGSEPFTWEDVPGLSVDDSPIVMHEKGVAIARPGEAVFEIGVAKGRSFIALMAMALLKEGVHAYAVDHFEGTTGEAVEYPRGMREEFECNMADADSQWHRFQGHESNRGHLMVADSISAAAGFRDGIAAYVFLDAAHDEASVRADIEAWLPKVRDGGILAGHDYHNSADVRRVVDELFPRRELLGECWFVTVQRCSMCGEVSCSSDPRECVDCASVVVGGEVRS